MKDVKDYQEYLQLYKDDLVKIARKILDKVEDGDYHDFEDSNEHNKLIEYFNKFALHKKITEERFNNWK